jgi:uncharacterized Zn finger protein (UPF0148 family)
MSESTNKAKRDQAIKRNGVLMLDGWKLIATMCPICNSALLRKDNNYMCTYCDLPIIRENDTNQNKIASFQNNSMASNLNKYVENLNFVDEDITDEPYEFHSLEEMKKEYDKKRGKQVNSVSSLLGEKLLAGWTLLGECCSSDQCEGTPLMRNLEGLRYCVSCKKTYIDETKSEPNGTDNLSKSVIFANNPVVNEYKQTKSPDVRIYQDMENAPYLDYSPPEEDDASNLIGEKLLLGWALLDKTCNGNCKGYTPLMRNKSGRVS